MELAVISLGLTVTLTVTVLCMTSRAWSKVWGFRSAVLVPMRFRHSQEVEVAFLPKPDNALGFPQADISGWDVVLGICHVVFGLQTTLTSAVARTTACRALKAETGLVVHPEYLTLRLDLCPLGNQDVAVVFSINSRSSGSEFEHPAAEWCSREEEIVSMDSMATRLTCRGWLYDVLKTGNR